MFDHDIWKLFCHRRLPVRFKKGLGYRHAIGVGREGIEFYVSGNSTATVCAVDISKAFPVLIIIVCLVKLIQRRIQLCLLITNTGTRDVRLVLNCVVFISCSFRYWLVGVIQCSCLDLGPLYGRAHYSAGPLFRIFLRHRHIPELLREGWNEWEGLCCIKGKQGSWRWW